MFCPNCGTQNADGARFCSGCGQALTGAAQNAGQQYAGNAPEMQYDPNMQMYYDPNSQMYYDPKSQMYYDPNSQMYYDPNSRLYYDPRTGQYYDPNTQQYVAPAPDPAAYAAPSYEQAQPQAAAPKEQAFAQAAPAEAPRSAAAPKGNSGIPLLYKILIPVLAVAAVVLLVFVIRSISLGKSGGGKDGKEPTVAVEDARSDASGAENAENSAAASSAAQNAQSGTGIIVNGTGAESSADGSASQGSPAEGTPSGGSADSTPAESSSAPAAEPTAPAEPQVVVPVSIERPSFFGSLGYTSTATGTAANVNSYAVAADLSNVVNLENYYLPQKAMDMLAQNGFFIMESGGGDEFFGTYEMNRYSIDPNFVTVDSIMHTYHLYFQYLMKNTERNSLSPALTRLSKAMLEKSSAQYTALKGTEWENAALRNVAFFGVGASLLDPSAAVPAEAQELVSAELALISAQAEITNSPIMSYQTAAPHMEDYTQYIVRGYYEGDETLEKYFRAMMWFGRGSFAQKDEDLDRSAALMTLALDADTLPDWEAIYTVTAFFAGASDDCGYYEYKPVLNQVYGENAATADLVGKSAEFTEYHLITANLKAPQINSVPTMDDGGETDKAAENAGFRFMGQRFSIDAAIFQNLIYSNVGPNGDGENRMLPDALDIPAALGSEKAYELLELRGETRYDKYVENMTALRAGIEQAPDELWTASLYSKWLDTLRPLLEVKGEGYPPFMQTDAWTKKNLQTFLGSYTELKHDTVLYSKQVIAEMGGDDFGEKDDRGYVEPEPEVYGRLTALVQATSQGLASYGLLGDEDASNLALLSELTESLRVIAEKELRNELPTDEEFELIRSYGGQLEHFWQEVYKDESEESYFTSRNFPAAIVTDVATDPNGSVLELGTGRTSEIYVIVPVDGTLRIATGTVYTFYQFEQPMTDRLTDKKWRQLLGIHQQDDGSYITAPAYKTEDWTDDFQARSDELS